MSIPQNDVHDSLCEAALSYAKLGWPVIPIHSIHDGRCTCRKHDCDKPAKHPMASLVPHGLKDATTDEATIRQWWRQCPTANVAVATGAKSGLVVLDVDPRHGGNDSLVQLTNGHGDLPRTVVANTGGGGHHFFLEYPNCKITNRANVLPGIDCRGAGGYVVVTPSKHASGSRYVFAEGQTPKDLKPAEMPPWVLRLLLKPPEPPRQIEGPPRERAVLLQHASRYVASASSASLGARNDSAFRLAGHVSRFQTDTGQCLAEGEILTLLQPWNLRCDPPMEEGELATVVQSAMRNGTPRDVHVVQVSSYDTSSAPSQNDQRKPIIVVDGDRGPIIDQAIAVLADQSNVYQRGGAICQVVTGAKPPRGIKRPPESPAIVRMTRPRMTELLSDGIIWAKKEANEGSKTCAMPGWLPGAVEGRGQWNEIVRIEGVVASPVMRADGSILTKPGYDPETGLLYRPNCEFRDIPANPTWANAEAARDELLEVVADFPFAWPEGRPQGGVEPSENPHAAVWLAAVLTLFGRFAFDGPTPLFLIDANRAGTGKGLLTHAAGQIAYGHNVPVSVVPRNDEEWRKRVTAIALAGDPVVLLDNVAGRLGSQVLDAALTSTTWKDRVLGASEMTRDLPLYATWFATSNNVAIGGDLLRRIAHIRLEYLNDEPESRSDFKHPRLIDWIRQKRPRLVAAALTILRAFDVAGRPAQSGVDQWGSYEGWSDLIRQAVVWVGMPDVAITRKAIKEADSTVGTLRSLLAGWSQLLDWDEKKARTTPALTVTELIDRISENRHSEPSKQVREALAEIAGTPEVTKETKKIGQWLGYKKQFVVDGMYLECYTDNKTRKWRVCRV